MSQPVYRADTIRFVRQTTPIELFPDSIQAAFDRLEKISKGANHGETTPSPENVEWAKKVLLRVIPRYYLLGAEIDHFDREIHVNWEHGNKNITVFLPAPNQVKIYWEKTTNGRTEHGMRPRPDDPWEISGVLRWLFSPNE